MLTWRLRSSESRSSRKPEYPSLQFRRYLSGLHLEHRRQSMLAIAGTGYSLIGVLVVILLVLMIVYFARRA